MAENTTRIPADKEHLLAVAIQNAWNGDFSLIDRLRAEIASAPTPVADGGGGDLGEQQGATPVGSGSQASPEAPTDPRHKGFDPQRRDAIASALADLTYEAVCMMDGMAGDTFSPVEARGILTAKGRLQDIAFKRPGVQMSLTRMFPSAAASATEAAGGNAKGGSVHEGAVGRQSETPDPHPQSPPQSSPSEDEMTVEALRPFAALADEIERLAAETGTPIDAWAKSCSWEDLERARAVFRTLQDNGEVRG